MTTRTYGAPVNVCAEHPSRGDCLKVLRDIATFDTDDLSAFVLVPSKLIRSAAQMVGREEFNQHEARVRAREVAATFGEALDRIASNTAGAPSVAKKALEEASTI